MTDRTKELMICPSCGRDSKAHNRSHYCQYNKERVVTWIDVHEDIINGLQKLGELKGRREMRDEIREWILIMENGFSMDEFDAKFGVKK